MRAVDFSELSLTAPPLISSPSRSFFSILISSFGFNTLDSLLYGAPGGAVVVVAVLFFLWLGDRIKLRCLCGMIPLAIGLVGILLIWLLPFQYKIGRLIGYYMCARSPALRPPRYAADRSSPTAPASPRSASSLCCP